VSGHLDKMRRSVNFLEALGPKREEYAAGANLPKLESAMCRSRFHSGVSGEIGER